MIEWAERFPDLMPAERIEMRLLAMDENTRTIDLTTTPKLAR